MEEFVQEEEVSKVQHRQRMNVRNANAVRGSSRKPRSRVEKASRRGVRSDGKSGQDGKDERRWEEGQRAEDQGPTCGVCTEVIVNYGVGSCGHFVCGDCAHRLRFMYRKKECPFCKTFLEELVVSESPDNDLEAAKKGRFHYDDELQMWFQSETVMKHYRQLRKPQCPSCGSRFKTVEALKQHVRSLHKKALCDTCVENRSKYLCDMELYSIKEPRNSGPTEIAKHLESHPFCLFCKEHVFDSDALYAHLQGQHESCFLCRRHGIQYEYYRNYNDLEDHYREDHFVCEHSACRGVVFDNPTDLKVHRKRLHDVGRGGNVRVNLSVFQAPAARHNSRRPNHRRRQNFEAQLANSISAQSASSAAGGNPPDISSRMTPAPVPRSSEQQTSDSDTGEPLQQTAGTQRPVMPSLPVSQEEESARNAVLLRSLRDALDVADFDQLRDASGQFRSGQVDAESYFETVDRLLGPDASKLLPEMTMLLRDGDQRAELSRLVRGAYRLLEAPSPDSVVVPEVESSSTPSGAFPALGGGQVSIRRSAHQYGPRSGQVTAGDFPSLGGDSARQAQPISKKSPCEVKRRSGCKGISRTSIRTVPNP
uniref:RING-type E3 ubiquitin transferase n=1 Tax=Rhodosorus marinus TaxID=101924 RepID=A0A7S3A5E2_9RHOD|mmetsp:Transcript_45336/g.176124  ORF Transcript_45336/g.176124 Transcript_45336/m.176124 type:complete len:594 (+) Transcript_45336:462-2243(+)